MSPRTRLLGRARRGRGPSARAPVLRIQGAALRRRHGAAAAPDRPEFRASLAGSQIVGLAMARYIVRVPPLADTDPADIVAAVGPTIERYLTGPLRST